MDTIKIAGNKPLMIAHRGVSGLECENTCAAFVAAGMRSYYGIETDVHVTKDGKFLICHNDDTEMMTGKKLFIRDTDYDVLATMRLTDPRTGEKRSDLVFPLLSDYISICKKYSKRSILEVKENFTEDQLRKMIEEISSDGYLGGVTFISFFADVMYKLRKILPSAKLQFLSGNAEKDTIAVLDKCGCDLDVWYPALNEENVAAVKSGGHEINCFTPDDPEAAKKLIDLGVDYITTNILE